MKERYLEVTFRKGRPIAAYLYLPRGPGQKSARTERATHGLLIDYAEGGEPIGVEIRAPERLALEAINRVLRRLKLSPLEEWELKPLRAA